MKRIMVATDGSEHAERAVKKALDLVSNPSDTTIDLVYAVDGETSKADVLHYGDSDTATFKREKRLKESAQPIEAAGVSVTIKILHGEPAKTLIEYANEQGYDLVLVGSRGRNKLQTMMLGSVSHKLVKYVDAPVMVIK